MMRTLSCLLLLGLWNMVFASSCPRPYRRFSTSHSYCIEPSKTCNIHDNSPVTPAEKEEIVRAHNLLRSKVATGKEKIGNLPQAADMMEMQWDDELAESARRWASQCTYNHDENYNRMTGDFIVGQCIAGYLTKNWTHIVHKWYSEVTDFDPTVIDNYQYLYAKPEYGHFAQVIWAKSWRVGCGYVNYTARGYRHTSGIAVCNYGPRGSYPNDPVYKKGEPCSQCPGNTCCGDNCKEASYPGLCQVPKGKLPIYPRRPAGLKFLYYCDFSDMEACNITWSKTKPWTLNDSLSGKYIGIVLKAGEETFVEVRSPIKKYIPASCFTIYYKKGSDDWAEKSANLGQRSLSSGLGQKPSWTGTLYNDAKLFYRQVGSMWVEEEYFVSITFKALAGTQYMEIKDIYVHEGSCFNPDEYD